MDDWAESSTLQYPGSIRGELLTRASGIRRFQYDSSKHILQTALGWKTQILLYQFISSTEIANQVDLSSGRVRQILRLTNLHPDVQSRILNLVKSKGKHAVPERFLRRILKAPKAQQMQRFEQLRAD